MRRENGRKEEGGISRTDQERQSGEDVEDGDDTDVDDKE